MPMSNPVRALTKRLGHQAWFAKLGKILVPMDKAVARLTGGRVVALGLIPSLTLTTVGRKSGLPRTQPLVYVSDGDDVILIGSNWGQPKHPAWSGNLQANPQATVRIKGRSREMSAQLLTGAERERVWQLALHTWPAYATYAKRAADREIRVFRLRPR